VLCGINIRSFRRNPHSRIFRVEETDFVYSSFPVDECSVRFEVIAAVLDVLEEPVVSTQKTAMACFSETLNIYQHTRRHVSEDPVLLSHQVCCR
jgi:hypothetical protein